MENRVPCKKNKVCMQIVRYFMPQVTIKEKGHIVFGLSVCAWMCAKKLKHWPCWKSFDRDLSVPK